MASIDIDALDASLGAYNRANHDMLLKQAFYLGESVAHMEIVPDVKDEKPLIVPRVKELSQVGIKNAFNPTADAFSFGNRMLKVRPAKVDLQIIPSQLHQKYLGVLYKSGQDPYQFPLEAFIMQWVMQQVAEDAENVRWNGVFAGGAAAGAGLTNAAAINDGFLHKIADEILATNLTAVTTGAITTSNAVASLEAMWTSLDDRLKKAGSKMYMSHTVKEAYNIDYRSKFGGTNYNNAFEKRMLELSGGKCELVASTAMAGSGRVILDPLGVMTIGTDLLSDENQILVEREKRALNIMVDYVVGVEFSAIEIGGIEYLKVNDQA
jgi:hypothetical protein